MDSFMDWTPTGPPRGIKRNADGTMVVESPYTPYPPGYIPGGWPASPSTDNIFAHQESEGFFMTNAKRLCYGFAACFTYTSESVNHMFHRVCAEINPMQPIIYTTLSVNNIVRRVRATQLRPTRPFQRIRRSASSVAGSPPRASTPQAATSRRFEWDHADHPFNNAPMLQPSAPLSPQVVPTPELSSNYKTPATCANLQSPFPLIIPTAVIVPRQPPAEAIRRPTSPVSPAAAQLLEELEEAADASDNDSEVSSSVRDGWFPPTSPKTQQAAQIQDAHVVEVPDVQVAGVQTTQGPVEPTTAAAQDHTSRIIPKMGHVSSSSHLNVPAQPRNKPALPATESTPESDISSTFFPTPEMQKTTSSMPGTSKGLDDSDISSTVPPTPTPSKDSAIDPTTPLLQQHISKLPSRETPAQYTKAPTPKSSPHSTERYVRKTRSISKRLLEAQEALKYDIQPLSKDWEAKVDAALTNGHKPYTTHDLHKVVPPPGSRSGTSSWLNDEVINGYLNLVCAHGNKDVKPSQTVRYHAFSSFFFTNLSTKGYEGVKRWSTRAKIGGKKLLDLDQVFVPINSGSHWTLCVVSPRIRHIAYYNSMSGGGARYIRHLEEWLKGELGSAYKEEEWMTQAITESPQQTNMSDCGVFTITNAKQIMLGHGVMSYKAGQIPTQRRRIVAELIAGRLIKSS